MNLQSEGGRFSRFAEVLLGFIEEYVGLYVYLKCDDASTTIFPKGQLLNCFIEVTYSLTLHKSLALGTFQVDLVVLALGKNLALGEVKLHWLLLKALCC